MVKKATVDFDVIADDLYRLRPDEFTTARDIKASEARASGDRALATAVKGLRRPTTSAWLANCVVHGRPDEYGRLVSLAMSMREASDRLDGDELRQLSRERHQVLAALVAAGRIVASGAGIAFSSAVSNELEATFAAALSDEEAAALLQVGRLTAPLRYTGFGSSGFTEAPSTIANKRGTPSSADHQQQAEPSPERRKSAPRRTGDLRSAQRELKTLEIALTAERRQFDQRSHIADEATARRDELRRTIHGLEQQLVKLRAEESKATKEAAAAEKERASAEQTVKSAELEMSAAQQRLDAIVK
jgi:hypothetical protein